MQQMKIFVALEADAFKLEGEINRWLKANPNVRVLQMSGNIAPQTETGLKGGGLAGAGGSSDILLCLLYEIVP